jgi:hypothetical protein
LTVPATLYHDVHNLLNSTIDEPVVIDFGHHTQHCYPLLIMASSSASSLSTLPNDCLLLVVDHVKELNRIDYRVYRKRYLINLSAVNKRFRALCLLEIFDLQRLVLHASDIEATLTRRLEAVAKAPFVPASLR